jgi:hypothetical protein
MHPKKIINKIHQMAAGPATSLLVDRFYLDEEVAQAELRRALVKGLGNSANYIDSSKTLKRFPELLLVFTNINIHIILKFGQHLNQKYFIFRKIKNYSTW